MHYSILSVVVVVGTFLPLYSAQRTYYVAPTPDTPCPGEPCRTLSEYVEQADQYFTSGSTFVFLSGHHNLEKVVTVQAVNNLTLCGNSSNPTLQSEVVCSSQPGGFSFDDVLDLYISTLTFVECGGSNNSAVSVRSVYHCEIENCTFQNNTNSNPDLFFSYGGAVTVFYSNITLSGCVFEHNSAKRGSGVFVMASTVNFSGNSFMKGTVVSGGVFVEDSIATFIGNTFMERLASFHGGGVALERSSANFITNTFMHNSAEYGAGVSVQDGTATFSDNLFVNNTHNIAAGGGVYLSNSTVNLTENFFINNCVVGASGGGVYVKSANILYVRGNLFKNNSATNGPGGGLRILSASSAEITGNNFTDNKALHGGGFFIFTNEVKFTANIFSNNCACNLSDKLGSSHGGAGFIFTGYGSFNDNVFMNNTAAKDGGGIYVTSGSAIDLVFNKFVNNSAGLTGGGISILSSTISFTENNFMVKNFAQQAGGAIFASNSCLTVYGSSTLENNVAPYGGGVMLQESNLTFLESAFFQSNEAMSGAAIYCLTGSAVTFLGNTFFSNNFASYEGGSIYASRSKLHFKGATTFTNNSAFQGGGLLLTDESHCFFNPSSYLYFDGNSVIGNGGAIKADVNKPFLYCINDNPSSSFGGFTFTLSECFFQISNTTLCNPSDVYGLNTRIYFNNNTANKGGNDVYGGQIDRCSLPNVNTDPFRCSLNSGYVFDIITNNEPEHLDISSEPLFVCSCSSNEINCTHLPYLMQVYPGGTIQISVIALGQRDGSIAAIIEADAVQGVIKLHDLEYTRSINYTCTDLNFTILSKAELAHDQLLLYAQGPCTREGRSVLVDIEVLKCPHGFELSDTRCDCETRLRRFTATCSIDTAMILRANGSKFWVGYDNNTNGLILHSHCPFDYCTAEEIHIAVDEPQSDMQCNYNRAGKLCGSCRELYSSVFGSSRCLRCSNSFLALTVVFALAGIALVLFVFILRLTVSVGTINGLIFYANVVQVNSSIFFPSRTTNILTIFIAWLNMDLGIECCFYNGMDIYAKTWLQFVFPIYVWILAGIIILVCHYTSGRISQMFGRNPTAVLATLFLLSYAKILRTIIVVFSFTFLEYPDHLSIAVWLYDGNTRYLQGRHIALFTVGLLFLVLLFIPYTLLLFLGQWLQTIKCFSWISGYRVRPILDAYHAPYTKKHRYWTGLLLLIRCLLFLIFAFNALGEPSVDLLAISSAVMGLIVVVALYTGVYSYNLHASTTRMNTQHITGVYNNSYIGALEVSFHFNLVILVAATYHINLAGGNQKAVTFFSVGIAFAKFVGIVIYHATLQVRDTNLWKTITTSNQSRSQNISSRSNRIMDTESDLRTPVLARNFTHSSVRLHTRRSYTDT